VGNGTSAQYKDIDAAKIAVDSLRQLLDVFITGQIRTADVTSPATGTNLFGNGFEGLGPAGHQANLGSLLGKGKRNGLADATAGSGYDRELIL
jgi:hypothetical protein